jgi:hypothetical protein
VRGNLLQQILVVLFLQQHDHVVKKQDPKLDGALLDGQQAIVNELVVCQIDVFELVGRFFVVR